MKRVTRFGKFCRKLRIDNGELLIDMANKLGVSSAFLSKVENGYKKPPEKWEDTLRSLYKLDENQNTELQEAIFEARNLDSIDISTYTEDEKTLMLSFARKFKDLDHNKLKLFLNEDEE